MILAKDNNEFGQLGAFLPICYQTNDFFRQAAPICPDDTTLWMATNWPAFLCQSLRARTATAPISIALMPAISRWLNGWERTKPSDGCTAKPVAHASANGKVHSCKAPNCRQQMLYALSNVSPTAVLLRRPQTYVKSILALSSDCWKRPASVQPISIAYNWKIWTNPSKRSRWMNYTAKQSDPNARRKLSRFQRGFVNASVKKGQDMASYGFGCKKQISPRIYRWPTYPSDRCAIDRFCGDMFQGQRPSADTYRRSLALPAGNPAGIRRYQTPSPQERQGQIQVSPSQTAFGFAGGCGKETSRQQRQPVEGLGQSVVWQKEGYPRTYSQAGHWLQDQHLSCGTAQRHDKRTAGPPDTTYSCRLPFEADAAIFYMALARFVQLDKGTLLVVGRNTCNGVGADRRGLECIEICFVSGSRQRPST